MNFAVVLFLLALTQHARGSDDGCTSRGGKCVDWRYYKCSAGVEQGLCDGDNNRRCCLTCDNTCVSNEQNYQACCDTQCTNSGGVCQDNSNYCAGSYSSGMCGGPSERQCCGGKSSSSCGLVTYKSATVIGYNGLEIEIEPGFKSSMDKISDYAKRCGVTVYVTHAYRDEGQDLGGTVVPPASTSNHLVGHAIDMNLNTDAGWCNGDCLLAGYNSDAECFVGKVNGDVTMRWGGVWYSADPVHIDDGLNVSDMDEWNQLYYDLQGAC